MSDVNEVELSLKVMINKQKRKVLFAEADSDFTDVLLSFLALPLGTIVRIMRKHYGDVEAPVIGSLTTLYNGLQNLNSNCFWTECCKQMLLNPRKSFDNESYCNKLKLNVDDTQPTKAFSCADKNCSFTIKRSPNLGLYYDTCKCDCGKSALSKDEGLMKNLDIEGDDDDGVFTKSTASFIISDDLQIMPSETTSAIRILSNIGIIDTDGTELRNVTFGFNQVMDLLKESLLSQTPLTDLILNKRRSNYVTHVKCETGTLPGEQVGKHTSNTKKMIVKAIMQESTNRLLFAEADGYFVDFLFSLFTIPLGAVGSLLGGSTSLTNIDNMYRSLQNINDDKYLKIQDVKTMLLDPELPTGYVSKSKILPLKEEGHNCTLDDVSVSSVKSPKGPGNYVKEQIMYMVTDDLTVTPLCTTSSISIINRLKVPLSDVKEVEMDIGLKEALGILRASLTSTCALTDGLMIKPTLNKRPKREHS